MLRCLDIDIHILGRKAGPVNLASDLRWKASQGTQTLRFVVDAPLLFSIRLPLLLYQSVSKSLKKR